MRKWQFSWLFLLPAMMLNANEQRWFEIEMIIFKRDQNAELREQFIQPARIISARRSIDLLTAYYQPDINSLLRQLPACDNNAAEDVTDALFYPAVFDVTETEDESASAGQLPENAITALPAFSPLWMKQLCILEQPQYAWLQPHLFASYYHTKPPFPEQLPLTPVGSYTHKNQPYLAQTDFQLTDIVQKLRRQRGINLLLHTAWRQAPVTERLAIPSRWYAGQNLSTRLKTIHSVQDEADSNSTLSTETEPSSDLLTDIQTLLNRLNAGETLSFAAEETDTLTEEDIPGGNLSDTIWQLDGLFKLHLDHYLFVNTEFNLNQLTDNRLESIYVRQSRRVISGEIHYLDHPYLGIILQIRRYQPPQS